MELAVQNGRRGGRLRVATAILAVNAGSSSLKFALFEFTDTSAPQEIARSSWPAGDGIAADRLLAWVAGKLGGRQVDAVGHRIVHGGAEFADPVEIDDELLKRLDALTPLAPLHQPAGLAPIVQIRTLRPDLRQFACFDTAFHRTMVPPASRYALPRLLEAEGIRRYGFHGLSYESIAGQLRAEGGETHEGRPSRVIVAHLGSGASLCAMLGLRSADTTMGFSVLDGLVMGTRAGSLDPGILLYLLKEKGITVEGLEDMLYRESGLLGVSGVSADVATLLASDAREAAEALDLFAFQIAKQTASLVASVGGVDRIIFTGGIGENAPGIRRMVVQRLKWLGAELDDKANEAGSAVISTQASSVLLERRPTQEELMIAGHVQMAVGA